MDKVKKKQHALFVSRSYPLLNTMYTFVHSMWHIVGCVIVCVVCPCICSIVFSVLFMQVQFVQLL